MVSSALAPPDPNRNFLLPRLPRFGNVEGGLSTCCWISQLFQQPCWRRETAGKALICGCENKSPIFADVSDGDCGPPVRWRDYGAVTVNRGFTLWYMVPD